MATFGNVNLNYMINTKLNQLNPIIMPEYLFFMNPVVLNENLN